MSKDNFQWTDKLVLDFHKSYIGSETENIYGYMDMFKSSRQPKEPLSGTIPASESNVVSNTESKEKELYTEKDLEDAFNAAREWSDNPFHTGTKRYFDFQDYINKQTV
jgi:hypothetical protein